MALTLQYFAWLRERIGAGEEVIDPPVGLATVADLIDWLEARGGGYAALADRARVRAAIDNLYVPFDAPIAGAREIALFPPVTGG